jgi:hypothetical protein
MAQVGPRKKHQTISFKRCGRGCQMPQKIEPEESLAKRIQRAARLGTMQSVWDLAGQLARHSKRSQLDHYRDLNKDPNYPDPTEELAKAKPQPQQVMPPVASPQKAPLPLSPQARRAQVAKAIAAKKAAGAKTHGSVSMLGEEPNTGI